MLSEYPTAKKVDFYFDRSKGILGVERIYVTDNFLFIPGLFVINRSEIENILIRNPEGDNGKEFVFLLISPLGKILDGDRFIKMYQKVSSEAHQYRIHPETGKLTYLSKDDSEEMFRLDYSYDVHPETAEQIMAWFWQCDPNDPTLPERTKAWYYPMPLS